MAGNEIICAGMVLVDVLVEGIDTLPAKGETGQVSEVSLATGGDAINEAISLAKLGNKVGLLGLIGNDTQGRFIRERCAQYGVDSSGLYEDEELGTSTSIVLIDKNGERSFLSKKNGTISAFAPEHIDLDIIKPGLRVLSVGSLFLSRRFDLEALEPMLRKAKSVGAITIADFVMDQTGYGLEDLRNALPFLDYVVPSELEAGIFTGSEELSAIASRFKELGVSNVIIKRGSKGASAFIDGEEISCPAFNVPVIDTTGAGDNFVGGLIHAIVENKPIDEALRFACGVAALSVGAIGAGAGLKDLEQVEAFLTSH